jgi:diacylglycerol kinase (ATP)
MMEPPMRVTIVYNPVSGSGRSRASADSIRRSLSERGWACESVATERADPAAWLAPVLEGSDALVVAGGDGAIRLAAPAASRAGIPIWHAPCGTENLFARAFGMTADPAAIASAIESRATRAIDLADADGVPFAIMASVGFDAEVVHALAATRRGAISHWSYAAPILEAMRSWRPSELSWEIEGERELLGRGLVVVGNLPHYGGRLNPAAGAIADDGLLDAVFIPADSAWDLVPWLPLLWTGLHRRHPGLRERRGASVVLCASRPVVVQTDGDAAPEGAVSTVSLTIRPAALRVLRAG